MTGAHKKHLRLGEVLVSRGVITLDQVNIALTEQKKSKEHLGKIMVRLGFATESIIRDVIGGVIGQESVDLSNAVADGDAVGLIPKEMARRLRVLPLTYDGPRRILTLAMADTFNVVALDQINTHLGGNAEVIPVLAGEAEIEKAIDKFYGFELSVDGILHEIETGEIDYQSLDAESAEYSQPVVRLVNALLADAVKRNASDIHFEPEEGFLRFRYRIDGVLKQVRSLHKNYWSAIAVRVKVMSGMDIAETRAPQDGRISLSLSGRAVDFRVSTLPTVHGENIVLRVLDRANGIVSFDQLGMKEDEQNTLKLMVARPEGIILVTGPTGSGKTVSLYTGLNILNTPERNISTAEDPVEINMPGINQVQVRERVGLTFPEALRAFLRQDPDVIMVGEIRDLETAEIGIKAAQTGHLVLSTLHTNSAAETLTRLLNMGVPAFNVATTVNLIIAQRLARRLCTYCRKPADDIPEKILEEEGFGNIGIPMEEIQLYHPEGCPKCTNGYKGRVGVYEVLKVTPAVSRIIMEGGNSLDIAETAKKEGFRTLRQSALRRAAEGIISLEEANRVTKD